MILDPTTNIGRMRLRLGDYSDFPIFPDEVYISTLEDCNQNLARACVLVATYILASLTSQTHQKMVQIEIYGSEWFNNYLKFVKATILNPNLMLFHPLPYTPLTYDEFGNQCEVPLVQFQKDWNNNYAAGKQSTEMQLTATQSNYSSYF